MKRNARQCGNLVENFIQCNSTYPDAGYLDWLDHLRKFVENSVQLSFLEITGYRIKCSTVLWLVELQIRCGGKV
jgi:hypothetical protein